MIRKTRKLCSLVVGALLLVLTGSAVQSEAGVSVNIGVNLPDIRFFAPPAVVVIPGTYVYMVPDADVDIMFYQGYWWRPYEGRWYRSRDYNRGWSHIDSRRIPHGLRKLPKDYRHRLSPRHDLIPNGEVQRNWKKWEKNKYWDKRHKNDRRGRDEQDNRNRGDQDRGGRDGHIGRY